MKKVSLKSSIKSQPVYGLVTTNAVDIRGKAFEEVFMEMIFANNTLGKNYVNFASGIKGDEIFSEITSTLDLQGYVTNPTASGSIDLSERILHPKKVELFDVFDPENLRFTRFNSDMASGAFENSSSEFERQMLMHLTPKISRLFEVKFWNSTSGATQVAVAALTPGVLQTEVSVQEQALVAATPLSVVAVANQFDGIIVKMIYNNAAVGGRVKVVGTTITASNIFTEYGKVYAAIPAELMQDEANVKIFAPHSHKQLIRIFNISETYRDKFGVEGTGANTRYFYNGIEILFVPVAENVMAAANPMHLVWLCDLESDVETIVVDNMPKPRKDKYYDVVATMETHVAVQFQNVLYVG